MQVIDLSLPIDNNAGWAPWWARTHVRRQGHGVGRLAMQLVFGVRRQELKTGMGWANEELQISTHGTTHLDAPWHYGPVSEGRPAKTIDQIPLEWCYAPGVKLDLRHKQDGEAITVADVQRAVDGVGYAIRPRDIVLIHTGSDRWWGTPAYFSRGCGMSAAATRWLIDQGVKIAGIDSWGWDVPLRRAARSGGTAWEGHFVGVEREYCHLERLTNLERLPPFGFTICCFPLRVARGSAGPARVVALLGTRAMESAPGQRERPR